MTFQPPPPPQNPNDPPPPSQPSNQPPPASQWGPPAGSAPQPQTPPPPPAGQWGPPPGAPQQQFGRPGGGPAFDPKSVNQLDWGILGAGFLAFIFSFVSYYTVSFGDATGSESAWHGFFGWFAMLLALVGSAMVGMELFAPQVKLPFPNRLIGLVAYAVATLSVFLALFIFPEDVPSGLGYDTGRGAGYWLSLIVIIAGLVLSFLRFQQTGGQLPIGGSRPGGSRRA